MSQSMAYLICNVVGRLVLGDDENPVRSPKKMRIPLEPDLIQFLRLWTCFAGHRFDEIRLFVKKKDFDGELPVRSLAEHLSKRSHSVFKVRNQPTALGFTRIRK